MANLKAQLQVQHENTKADLQDKVTRATRKDRTSRPKSHPNLIKATCSHSSSVALATPVHLEMELDQPTPSLYSIEGSEMQHACMLIDSAPDTEESNSPTPTADVPLALSAVTTSLTPPDPVMAILVAIQKQMEKTDTHLQAIKMGANQSKTDNYNVWGAKYSYDTMGVREVGQDTGLDDDYCTPEQASALAALQFEKDWVNNMEAYEAHKLAIKYEEEHKYTQEKHQQHWDKEHADFIMNNATSMEADPIAVKLQDTVPPACHLTSHLVPDQGCAPIPGLVWVANPP
jgi:hypothetical protein